LQSDWDYKGSRKPQ